MTELADVVCAFELGRQVERVALAERWAELDALWQQPLRYPPAYPRRRREIDRAGADWRARNNRPAADWPGGTPEQAREWVAAADPDWLR